MQLDKTNLNKFYTSIQYPGIVQNVDKALETLGGISEISKVFSKKNRRLELRFRPDDLFCKPACGDRFETHGILLKVRFLKKENEKPIVRGCEVVGRVTLAYKFKSNCDFQCLPMVQNQNGEMEDILDTILPSRIDGNNIREWLEKPASLFLPPAAFSRIDSQSINTYMYRKDNKEDKLPPGPLIGRTRKRRGGHAIFVSFTIPKIPAKPREIATKYLGVKFLTRDHVQTIKKCFEERPVWSKLALMCVTSFSHEQLKYLLPVVAYYFVTGPFRVMWIRLGYDPRSDSSSRIYQTLDYRIRAPAGLLNYVKAKRSYANYFMPCKSNHPGAKDIAISKNIDKMEKVDTMSGQIKKEAHIYRADVLPPARQMFYQYCDVKLPEVEAMLSRLPKVPAEATCHLKHGWLPPGFDQQCREILNNYVLKVLRKEAASGDEGGEGEDEGDDSSDNDGGEWEEEFDDEDVDEDDDENPIDDS